jgi:hypothetical protein
MKIHYLRLNHTVKSIVNIVYYFGFLGFRQPSTIVLYTLMGNCSSFMSTGEDLNSLDLSIPMGKNKTKV